MRRMGTRRGSPEPIEDPSVARVKAVAMLARREHSTAELTRKLTQKGIEKAVAESVVDVLNSRGMVSDERFAASFVRYRANRGYGPSRVRLELAERGIDVASIAQHLAQPEVDWNDIAATVRQRKFGSALPGSFADRAKQTRFLQYRGFTSDQIRYALQSSDDDADQAPDPFD
jgi:regulatory protein